MGMTDTKYAVQSTWFACCTVPLSKPCITAQQRSVCALEQARKPVLQDIYSVSAFVFVVPVTNRQNPFDKNVYDRAAYNRLRSPILFSGVFCMLT